MVNANISVERAWIINPRFSDIPPCIMSISPLNREIKSPLLCVSNQEAFFLIIDL